MRTNARAGDLDAQSAGMGRQPDRNFAARLADATLQVSLSVAHVFLDHTTETTQPARPLTNASVGVHSFRQAHSPNVPGPFATPSLLDAARTRVAASYATRAPFHIESGKGTTSKAIKFQVGPDPLAK